MFLVFFSSCLGQPQSLFESPCVDGAMVSRKEDLRHGPSLPLTRSCVVGMVELASLRKGVLNSTLFVTEDPGQEANGRFCNCKSRQLSTGEYEVSDRDLIPLVRLTDALVESFVSSAEKEQSLFACEFTS